MKSFTLLKKNNIGLAVGLILMLLLVNSILTYRNKTVIKRSDLVMRESDEINYQCSQLVAELLHNLDLGIRGYAVTKNDTLFGPAASAIEAIDQRFDNIKKMLQAQDYDTKSLEGLREAYHGYADFILEMKHFAKIDSLETFSSMLKEDRGQDMFMHWYDVCTKISGFENEKKEAAKSEYESAINNNLYLQLFTLLIGAPTLGYVILKIRKDERERLSLLVQLEENNRKYIFNPGTELIVTDPKQVIHDSIINLQQASEFIENISEGNYTAAWSGLNNDNKALNETNLAGRLSNMCDQLKHLKREEERRLWTNEGLTKFSETVRNNQTNLVQLTNEVIRFLTKYLDVQQGGLFVVRRDERGSYLELAACYAYDRKKFAERRIEIGEGLIGQTYLEGQTTLLTKLPQGYTYITSGMGETTPRCVVIVPTKYNNQIEAIIELASLEKFEDYHIAFLEKAGEFIASALQSARTTEKMHELLSISQRQTEEMRATEEEMRQNYEELQATQEAMVRKQEEMDRMQEEEADRARELAEANRRAANLIVEKLKAAENEILRLKEERH
jgi:CHASE3 domain sensor protein/GAF domain-containing protein